MSKTQLKIDKGIPIPTRVGGLEIPLEMLNIGDSVFVKNIKSHQIATSYNRMREKGLFFTSRKWKNGVRVWRIAPPKD